MFDDGAVPPVKGRPVNVVAIIVAPYLLILTGVVLLFWRPW